MRNDAPQTSLGDCLAHDMYILPSASLITRVAFQVVCGFDERFCGHDTFVGSEPVSEDCQLIGADHAPNAFDNRAINCHPRQGLN
jgi:hypothetical protein